jgi:Icc protein
VAPELSTVADDLAVVHEGREFRVYTGLQPDTDYEFDGVAFRTLPRPPGERLATVATVNDLHFGEVECGVIEGLELGPILSVGEGEDPYPETMNRAAAAEIAELGPDAVVAKGDLTAGGEPEEFAAFLDCYQVPFGERLHYVRGNHDSCRGQELAVGDRVVDLPGVRLAILDTVVPRREGGRFTADQAEWLDTVAAESDRPVLVFGHHHPWSPDSTTRPDGYFGINPTDSERLVAVFARRPRLVGYFAGHTHRNRVRRFRATGAVPWVEVACVKDFPGAWAEYRVHEGGIIQVHHRISSPAALDWSERTRHLYGGMYETYAFGTPADRCFLIPVPAGA